MAVAGEIRQSHGSLAEAAMEMIQDGMVVGLGSGHTVAAVIKLLGRRVQDGLHIRGVPTSGETAQLATGREWTSVRFPAWLAQVCFWKWPTSFSLRNKMMSESSRNYDAEANNTG